ncbi:MAG: MFS transporter, partial [Micrococcales bacterium]|nr:MFS transporter [Micrococcales bacterium]
LPVLVIALDNTVLSFAVPQLTQALHPSSTQLLWIIDVYPLCLAGLLVTMGMLGDRLGRRRMLLIGTAGFALVGFYAAFAPSPGHLIAARAVRGVFGAMLMPSTLSLMRNLFARPSQRRLAIAIWAACFAGGAALGPVVGGFILEHFAWNSIFLMTLPLAIALLVAGPFLLPESRTPSHSRIDVVGIGMSIMALLPFVYGVKDLVHRGVTFEGLAWVAVSVVFAVTFTRRQLAASDPLLDMRLFRNRVFSASIAANFLSVFAFAGFVFYLSQYLQLVLRLEPMRAGTYLIPGALASIVAGLAAVALAKKLSLQVLVPTGIIISAVGYGLAATLTARSEGLVIIVIFALVGIGAGLAETLTNDAILANAPADRAGAASGLSETAYELGTSLGVAILGSLLTAIYRSDLKLPAGVPVAIGAEASQTLGGAVAAASQLPEPAGRALLAAGRDAFMHGVQLTSIGAALVCVAAAAVVVPALRTRR